MGTDCGGSSAEDDSLEIVIPTSLTSQSGGGDCSMLIQIDPENAQLLDFEGTAGAVGRIEADKGGIMLDLKGYQFEGTIHTGPTVMILAATNQQQLKVDAVTDEFVTLTKRQDVMAKLNAVVSGNVDSYQEGGDDENAEELRAKSKEETSTEGPPPTKKRKTQSRRKKK